MRRSDFDECFIHDQGKEELKMTLKPHLTQGAEAALIFIHIPKAAGTTLSRIITEKVYGTKKVGKLIEFLSVR
jgi:hypothetical protein